MNGAVRLTTRQETVLQAVIAGYLRDGEPVGSGTIARAAGQVSTGAMSAATIRNEMAALTAAGLLEQPHTSSGRVPSAAAFRHYVDGLMRGRELAVRPLPPETQRAIDDGLETAGGGAEGLFARASELLAAMTTGVGVAVASAAEHEELEHVYFSRLGAGRVLAVIVTRGGAVRDRVLGMERDVPVRELEAAAAVLNERFRGWTVQGIRAELQQLVERERSEYQRLLQQAETLWRQAAPEQAEVMVYVGGVGNLVDDAAERERLRALLQALEAKEQLVTLLDAYLQAQRGSVRVVFDMETQRPEMAGLVLIGSGMGERRGAIGVIGRTRMDYESTIQTVQYLASTMNRML